MSKYDVLVTIKTTSAKDIGVLVKNLLADSEQDAITYGVGVSVMKNKRYLKVIDVKVSDTILGAKDVDELQVIDMLYN